MVSTIRHSVMPGAVDVEFALVREQVFDAGRVWAPVEKYHDSTVLQHLLDDIVETIGRN